MSKTKDTRRVVVSAIKKLPMWEKYGLHKDDVAGLVALVDSVRCDALEEAAKVADEYEAARWGKDDAAGAACAKGIAAAIRKLGD